MPEDTEIPTPSPETNEDIFTPNRGHQDWIQKLPGLNEHLKPYQIKDLTLIGLPTKIILDYLVETQADQPHNLNTVFQIFYNELRQYMPASGLKLLKIISGRQQQLQTTGDNPASLVEAEQDLSRVRESTTEQFVKVPLQIRSIGRLLQQPVLSQLIESYVTQYGNQTRIDDRFPVERTYGQVFAESLKFTNQELKRLADEWSTVSQDDYFLNITQ